jgi:hypothetical protein
MPMKKTKNTARLFYCACCLTPVVVCSRCDRGNIYCGSTCSACTRTLNHRIANQQYQRSLKGRLKHAQRQRRYRERQKAIAKKVTDMGSPVLPPNDVLPDRPNERPSRQVCTAHCHFCGEPVSLFLRNGFLRHHMNDGLSSWPLGP